MASNQARVLGLDVRLSPAHSALEDPIYDIDVLDCKTDTSFGAGQAFAPENKPAAFSASARRWR